MGATPGPTPAGLYDALLGGSSSYQPDRDLAAALTADGCPDLAAMVKTTRDFVLRAVTWAAGEGISQFIDAAAGYPVRPSVAETARQADPHARVAYADSNPGVVAVIRAVESGDRVAAAHANVADPGQVLGSDEVRRVIDFGQPVCVLLPGILSTMRPDAAQDCVSGLADGIAPGSIVVASVVAYTDKALGDKMAALYAAGAGGVFVNYSAADIGGLFCKAGLDLIPPGIVGATSWRGGWQATPGCGQQAARVVGGAGRKP